jgi:DNA-binding transcriptional MerR regulator
LNFLGETSTVRGVDTAVRIGELARRTGVRPELLRAWETRYGLLRPTRTSGGFRLYSPDDEARVRHMTSLLSQGLSAAEAARQSLAMPEPPVPAQLPVVADLRDRLQQALDAFDYEAAHATIDRMLATLTIESAIADIVIPYLRDLGERWQTRRASVAQEHFASNLLRGRLMGLARDWGSGNGPSALLAALPGEAHDLPLVMFGLLVGRRGWRVTFLGADTPFDTVDATVETLRPSAVVLSTIDPKLFHAYAEPIAAVAWRTRLSVAAPVDEHAVAAVGARLLRGGIVEAARSLTA